MITTAIPAYARAQIRGRAMPDEPEYANAARDEATKRRTTEQILYDIEALLLEIRAMLKTDLGTGRLGHD